jgi:transglutaminase-like putative cysteine protease
MLAAALAAQVSMWAASHRACYLIGAALLVVVVTTSSVVGATTPLDRTTGAPARHRVAAAVKLAACVALIAACALSVVTPALRDGKPPSTTDAIGMLLLVAHLVQTATSSSRRDVALSAPLVAAMVLQAGVAASKSAPAIPFMVGAVVLALAAAMASLATLHRAELVASAGAISGLVAPTRRALAQAGGAAACGALVFVLLPAPAHLGSHHAGDSIAPTGSVDLRERAPLSDAAVFVTDASAPAYWQGAIYDHYDGSAWTVTASPTTRWTTSRGSSAQTAPAADQGNTRNVSRTDGVEVTTTQPLDAVFAPGQATAYLGPGSAESDAFGNVTLARGPATGSPAGRTYQVQSTQPAATAAQLQVAAGADPADQRWLRLPADLPSQVSALARQVAAGETTRADTVDAVENYLRSNEKYDLAAPTPAAGSDAVADFLFASHRGFCEQFASAAVVMLRTLGVPARLVTGYAHGDTAADPGKRVFRESDAHAWVQVWFPGVGWVNSDPTPPAPTAAAPPDTAGSAAAASDHHEHWTPLAVVAVMWRAGADLRSGVGGVAAPAVVSLVVAALVGGCVLAARRRRARRTPSGGATPAHPASPVTPRGPVLAAYLRLTEATRPAAPAQTMREAAARLGAPCSSGASVNPAPEIQRALDLLERECYGTQPLSESEIEAAVAAFAALGRLVPA